MERFPTQTDLQRLCLAAKNFTNWWNIYHEDGEPSPGDWDNLSRLFGEVSVVVEQIPVLPPFLLHTGDQRDYFHTFWRGWREDTFCRLVDLMEAALAVRRSCPRLIGPDDREHVTRRVCPDLFAPNEADSPPPTASEAIARFQLVSEALWTAIQDPMPFRIIPDRVTRSFRRDISDCRDVVARLDAWFPIIERMCERGGFLSHESASEVYFECGFTGKYPNAFKKALHTTVNTELIPLKLEIAARRGHGWEILSLC